MIPIVTVFVQYNGKMQIPSRKNVIKLKKSKDCDLAKFAFILYNLHVKLGRSLMGFDKNKQESEKFANTA